MIRLRNFTGDQLDNAATAFRTLAIASFGMLFKDASPVVWLIAVAGFAALLFISHYILAFKSE